MSCHAMGGREGEEEQWENLIGEVWTWGWRGSGEEGRNHIYLACFTLWGVMDEMGHVGVMMVACMILMVVTVVVCIGDTEHHWCQCGAGGELHGQVPHR